MPPSLVALDFETTGLDYYHKDFKILSIAIAYNDSTEIKTIFYDDINDINSLLEDIAKNEVKLLVYNAGFELGVLRCKYPHLTFKLEADVMRLVQVFDNGDTVFKNSEREEDDFSEEAPAPGLSLKIAGPRILGKVYVDGAKRAKDWLYANLGLPPTKFGSEGIRQLPREELKAYNDSDVINTLNLYTEVTDYFKKIDYDWRVDHQLYLSSCNFIVRSKIEGVEIDRLQLLEYKQGIEQEIQNIKQEFENEFFSDIEKVRDILLEEERAKRKTEKGKDRVPKPEFNVGSNRHLAMLFTDVLGVETKLWTRQGKDSKTVDYVPAPSFKKAHLHQWGRGGEILAKRRQRMLVKAQCEALLELSEYDNRFHINLNTCGTKSGRFTSGASN